MPPGDLQFSMTVDGYDKPIDLVATMKIGDTGIDVDFAGTSGVSAYGINVPLCYTEAYASFGVKCIVAPHVPEQRRLARDDPRHRARGLHPERQASRAGRRRATSSARCCPT